MIDSVRHRKQKASIELSCRLAQRQCAQTDGCFFFLQTITSHSTSTRPHGARQLDFLIKSASYDISIHAPAWGATCIISILFNLAYHFNPRARVGRDAYDMASSQRERHFNPRARVGRDCSRFARSPFFRHFNPRACVGRDKSHQRRRRRPAHFNPRARVGRDHSGNSSNQSIWSFQSTRPRGARLNGS